MKDVLFGFQAAASDVAGVPDHQLYGTPLAIRQKMMVRFAEEICPRYSSAMRKGRAA
jgi:hypothetical protein